MKQLCRLSVSVVTLSVSLALTSVSADASGVSAASLASAVVRDAVASKSVHEVVVTTAGKNSFTMVNDVGTHEGRQVITFSNGATTEVIAFDSQNKAYIEGNDLGLKTYFGFPATDATQYAGEWMKIVSSSGAWSSVTNATTLKSDFSQLSHIVHPVLSTHVTTVNGARAQVLTGHLAASSNGPAASVTLYVSDTTTPLPLRIRESAAGTTINVNWTKWGEPLSLTAPSKSVPLP